MLPFMWTLLFFFMFLTYFILEEKGVISDWWIWREEQRRFGPAPHSHFTIRMNLLMEWPPCHLVYDSKALPLQNRGDVLVAQLVKNPPAIQETWVWSLSWDNPLEEGMTTTPVFWPGEFHGLYSPWGHKESDMTEWLSFSLSIYLESCLEAA